MFKLPEEVRKKYSAARADEAMKKAVFANLSDGDLAATAKFWMAHCEAPERFEKNEPVYDSTFWHCIMPEILRRLEG